jgi:ribosomal protein L7/L12
MPLAQPELRPLAAVAVMARSTPVRVRIPVIGVDTSLMRLGLRSDGSLQVPPRGFPAGWYTGGLALSGLSSTDGRVTVRFRVVRTGATSHYIIPMRWPDNDSLWTQSEQDWCESSGCTTFLHYGTSGSSQISHDFNFDTSAWHTFRGVQEGAWYRVQLDGVTVWATNDTRLAAGANILRHVVLQQVGPRPVQVMAIISQATGLDLVSASNLARDAPVVVVSGISDASADRVVERLQKAGARAVSGESYRSE